jgi:hypothetical protein
VLLDPLSDLGKMLILLADVVLLAEVDEVDDRLGSKQEKGVNDLDLCFTLAESTTDRASNKCWLVV